MGHRVGEWLWFLAVFAKSRSGFTDLSAELELLWGKKARWATELASGWWFLAVFVKSRSGFADLSAELEML